jgi:hypothetical protein
MKSLDKAFLEFADDLNDHDLMKITKWLHQHVTVHSIRRNEFHYGIESVTKYFKSQLQDNPTFMPGKKNEDYRVFKFGGHGIVASIPRKNTKWKDKTNNYQPEKIDYVIHFVSSRNRWLLLNGLARGG